MTTPTQFATIVNMNYQTFIVTRDDQVDTEYLEEYLDEQYSARKREVLDQTRQSMLKTLKRTPIALFTACEVIVEHIVKA